MALAYPSLLLFGPQSDLPSAEVLQSLRQELITSPRLFALKQAILELPHFWARLSSFDTALVGIPGPQWLEHLKAWVETGGLLPRSTSGKDPTLYTFAVTAALQIIQYSRYLNHLGPQAHEQVLSCAKDGGVQGFCVGFLAAVAVATSHTEFDVGTTAAIALRLAVSIGAYVDLDGSYASKPLQYQATAIRWKESSGEANSNVHSIVESPSSAYISSVNDDTSVTVTANAQDTQILIKTAADRGWRATAVPVYGRFHLKDYSSTVERLMQFVERSTDLEFLDAKHLSVPLRNTVDGQVVTSGSLTRLALQNTLSQVCDWYTTIKAAAAQLPDAEKTVVVAGFGNCVPSSLSNQLDLRIVKLSDLQAPKSCGIGKQMPIGSTYDLSQYPRNSIAIVGMAGRFPGADSVDELWDLMLEGRSTVERAPADLFGLPQTGDYANTKWWGNFLKDRYAFDHKFFKKSSREAIAWDPQQRILLEVIYEALESSGYFGASDIKRPDDFGCYIGAVSNNHYDVVTGHSPTAYATVGTSRCYISGCMSHYFGWTGPSLTIDTACSSSLVAINAACHAIISGECSRAVAGGTNVIGSPFDYQNLGAAGFLSPSGQCKPFDADADGYCRAEGVAVVVLKPLADAIQDNDNIHGVIVGSAANQNYNCGAIVAPYSASQVELYSKVMKLSGVQPESVSYIEAHGTGTGVGDPIEVRSLIDSFGGAQRESLLHFASIKGNIGHTEATAGICGLIKTLLMMRHRKILQQASHNSLNAKIPSFEQFRMKIPREVIPWESKGDLLALVNSYGAAGSNSAAMIRQAPLPLIKGAPKAKFTKCPIFISAGSKNSLQEYCKKLLSWLQTSTGTQDLLASCAFNLADRGNHALSHTLALTADSISNLTKSLTAAANNAADINPSSTPESTVLVFGGQESEFIGLSQDLYLASTIFRNHLDMVNELLVSAGLESFYPSIFESTPASSLVVLHTSLFAVQYASAKSWIACGLKVDAVIGHSFGQLTALCISGVLSLPDALKLVAGRASLMQTHWGDEPGTMLFMQADRQTVEGCLRALNPGLYAEIACYNGPEGHVVVGSADAIEALQQHVANAPHLRGSVRTKRLNVTNGFHSKFTDPMLSHLADLAVQLDWKVPVLHLETTDEAESNLKPHHTIVAEHTRRPVFFQKAVERLASKFPKATWLEAGRGSSVIGLVRNSLSDSQGHTFHSPQLCSASAQDSLTDITVNLWKKGHAVQWWPFHRSQRLEYNFLSLPPIQFEKTRHWLSFKGRAASAEASSDGVTTPEEETHELLSFLEFADRKKEVATFRIDPKSERFQTMLGGHVMAGQALAPASLYFEVVARAALFLQDDVQARTYVPTTHDLHMRSPIGQSTTKEIRLVLKKLTNNPDPSWSFSITTRETEGNFVAEPFEHSTGNVVLNKREDARSAREFERFSTLTARRYEEVLSDPDAETMQGSHIYRAFNTVVYYGKKFQGIKKVVCKGFEAAGKVCITPPVDEPADLRLCDTPMTDSFMQFAGFLVNYFNNPSMEDVFVCQKIEFISIGAGFDPDAGEWAIYATMSEANDVDYSADAYVFDTKTKKMVMAAFGFRFSKMSQTLLARMLKSVNKQAGSTNVANAKEEPLPSANEVSAPTTSQSVSRPARTKSTGKRSDLLQILSNITDVPIGDITDNSTLDDLGVDSLMATEVLNDIRSSLGLTIDLSGFLFFHNIKELVDHVNQKLGFEDLNDDDEDQSSSDSNEDVSGTSTPITEPDTTTRSPAEKVERPSMISAVEDFEKIRFQYDIHADSTKATGFWKDAYPHQARLVLKYVVEAFAALGCDLTKLRNGELVPRIQTLSRHKQLVDQLYRVLEDGALIKASNGEYKRTEHKPELTSAESIYQEIVSLHPQHATIPKLVKAVGSELAECLRGDKDGLQVVFGNRETKKVLEEFYEYLPLFQAPSLVLGDFVAKAFSNKEGNGKFRILEIGAGTGGTTRHILRYLKNAGIDFKYVFTDLSASLVNAMAKQFKGTSEMSFEVLDIETHPKPEHVEEFDLILATNCIHATRNLDVSLKNIRKMLRKTGALTLIEITQNMFSLDIIVGLFEGWWLFDDGREHALVSERHWSRKMKAAGFEEVSWSEGASPESKTVRVIAGFPTARPTPSVKTVKTAMETVVYKHADDVPIHADIYYPAESEPLSTESMPVALMIHGGSHMIFSRKDIRPTQTRYLLAKGFLPVSLDYRLTPEIALSKGPMIDVIDALSWARNELPSLQLKRGGLKIDGERVVVVGWSSGAQLAMSTAWLAPQYGLTPPSAILAFYGPTDYEDEWWQKPIHPIGSPYTGQDYDLLEAVQDKPITNYTWIGAWEEPVSDPTSIKEPRCRMILHINWKAQTLPVILNGLPSKKRAALEFPEVKDWQALPQPSLDVIQAASPRAHINNGTYQVPTFFIHGTADDLIPWQQSQGTFEALKGQGIETEIELLENAPHICDTSSDPRSAGWKATLKGYDFLARYV